MWICACAQNHVANIPTLDAGGNQSTSTGINRPDYVNSTEELSNNRPVAMLDGQAITLRMMQERLFEHAGAETLRELQLERALQNALKDKNLLIEDEAIKLEEDVLLQQLSTSEDSARSLLSDLRSSEGLGPVRYRALLWRNAALRALVQDDIVISEPLLERLHRMQHGPRIVIRLIVVSTLQEAEELHARVEAGESFGQLAATRSIDSSRDRGGLLAPISLEDPTWPAALRTALEGAAPNQLTEILFLDDRFAIAHVDSVVTADGLSLESNRDEVTKMARMTQERIKMATLAGRLGTQQNMNVLNPTLRRSWKISESANKDLR